MNESSNFFSIFFLILFVVKPHLVIASVLQKKSKRVTKEK